MFSLVGSCLVMLSPNCALIAVNGKGLESPYLSHNPDLQDKKPEHESFKSLVMVSYELVYVYFPGFIERRQYSNVFSGFESFRKKVNTSFLKS